MQTPALWGVCLSVLLSAVHCSAAWHDAGFQPRIEVEYKVFLSTGMKAALKKYDPEFKIWRPQDFGAIWRGLYEYKSFQPSRSFLAYQTPSAVIGDFNGDGIPDAALSGHTKTYIARLVVLSKGKIYEVIVIDKSSFEHPYSDMEYMDFQNGKKNWQIEGSLELVKPGKIKAEPAYNRPEIDLKTDAFQYGGESASSLYYYSNGKFLEYALSD